MPKEKVLPHATLCFPVKKNKVLLSLKMQNIGQGYLNGYGGGIRKGETREVAAIRELWEEVKLTALAKNLEKVAIVDFHNTKSDGQTFVCRVHVYLISRWGGRPKSTKEMIKPTWFAKAHLPFDKMMSADRIWLPIVLSGKKIVAKARYGPFQKELLGEVEIQEVDSFLVN